MAIEKIRFNASGEFTAALHRNVNAHFAQKGMAQRDAPAMYRKTAVILLWLAASYFALLFWAHTWWQVVPLAASLGLAMAGVGFNIQHDGGHGAYSQRPWINALMAHSLDLVGGSSYVWHWKHNVIHHTYANIAHVDADVDVGAFARLTPHHTRRAFHRFQHLYIWFLYGMLPFKWHFHDDFHDLLTGHIGTQLFPRPKPGRLAVTLAMKAFFIGWAIVVPLLLRPWQGFLLAYGVAAVVCGVTLAIVFQLAHAVGEAEFPIPAAGTHHMDQDWALHQVQTTVDFARESAFFTWYLGGLNFQVEHHLFPKISHVYFPELAGIVEQTCKEFGVPYRSHTTFWSGVAAHTRHLRAMGKAPVEAAARMAAAA